MKHSPLSIKQQEFSKGLRGYDAEEVRTFLDSVAAEYEEVIAEKNSLIKKLAELKEQNQEFRKIEKSLQATLINVQESSDRALDDTKKKTTTLLQEAETKAESIISRAKTEAEDIRLSVNHLREEKRLLLSRLKAIIETQANLLNITFTEDEQGNKTGSNKADSSGSINVDEIVEKLL